MCCAVLCQPQNEEAEELMRHVEQEEEEAAVSDPGGLQLHLCIINLVIGTLYCSKVGGWVSRGSVGADLADMLWPCRLVAAT